MATNPWKWKRGPKNIVLMTSGATIARGTPCYISSNVLAASGDGGSVDLICDEDCESGDTDVPCILPMGDVFEVKVATGTNLGLGDRAYMAANETVDAGTAGNISQLVVVDYNPASGGCADIAVASALLHPRTYGGS